jgi:hypothetical protein
MLRSVCCVIIVSSLTACVTNPFVKEKFVEIPVPVSCVTWEPTREPSTFAILGAESPVWEQVKALLVDRERDKIFIEGQQAVIEGCK